MIRTGIGFDAHRLIEGRKLVLGGVPIRFERGLLGHSDADVLVHALMDALLGALALGDIGAHFPDSDPAFRDADSMLLLRDVCKLVKQRALLLNVDVTVIAEQPRLSPYMTAIRERLAVALDLPGRRVSVKATTVEGMGALGREEGIAALAIVTVDDEEET